MVSEEDLLNQYELILSKTSNHGETLSYLRDLANRLEKPEILKSLGEHAKSISEP